MIKTGTEMPFDKIKHPLNNFLISRVRQQHNMVKSTRLRRHLGSHPSSLTSSLEWAGVGGDGQSTSQVVP